VFTLNPNFDRKAAPKTTVSAVPVPGMNARSSMDGDLIVYVTNNLENEDALHS
jgi:hypothetical protein